jgi:hypothetical protein
MQYCCDLNGFDEFKGENFNLVFCPDSGILATMDDAFQTFDCNGRKTSNVNHIRRGSVVFASFTLDRCSISVVTVDGGVYKYDPEGNLIETLLEPSQDGILYKTVQLVGSDIVIEPEDGLDPSIILKFPLQAKPYFLPASDNSPSIFMLPSNEEYPHANYTTPPVIESVEMCIDKEMTTECQGCLNEHILQEVDAIKKMNMKLMNTVSEMAQRINRLEYVINRKIERESCVVFDD